MAHARLIIQPRHPVQRATWPIALNGWPTKYQRRVTESRCHLQHEDGDANHIEVEVEVEDNVEKASYVIWPGKQPCHIGLVVAVNVVHFGPPTARTRPVSVLFILPVSVSAQKCCLTVWFRFSRSGIRLSMPGVLVTDRDTGEPLIQRQRPAHYRYLAIAILT